MCSLIGWSNCIKAAVCEKIFALMAVLLILLAGCSKAHIKKILCSELTHWRHSSVSTHPSPDKPCGEY
jgi:hypothetical protein